MRNTEPPELLYHYCPLSTLIGIAENRTIWLSNIYFLNDKLEHLWYRKLAIDTIEDRQAILFDQAEVKSNDKTAMKTIRAIHGLFDELKEKIEERGEYSNDYCGCFSELPDSLSQWRGYGDDGYGFAIGFDRESLAYDAGVRLVEVDYDRESQVAKINDELDHLVAAHNEHSDMDLMVRHFVNSLWYNASSCKNHAFHEEKEWRVVFSPDLQDSAYVLKKGDRPLYRQRGRELIPYYNWLFSPGGDIIKELWFGPKNTSKEQEIAIIHLLESNAFKGIEIRHSEASYR